MKPESAEPTGPAEARPTTEWITIAVLGRTHANRGEITGVSMTNRLQRFDGLREVYLFPPTGDGQRFAVESVWEHGNRLVFKFQGIDNISDGEAWHGAEVRVPIAERAALEEGEFYYSDLIGCEVWERKSGDRVGTVVAVQEYGGPRLLELDSGLLVPFAKSICINIDPAAHRIDVDLPEGLRDLNQP